MKCKTRSLVAIAAIAVVPVHALADTINMGTAGNFAVLAGSGVTNTGSTVIDGGDVGASPTGTVTGFPPGALTPPYVFHLADGVAIQAQNDLTTAYNDAAGRALTDDLTGQDLGGLTLTPGVYFFSSSAGLTGTLTLNYLGDPDALFVFQIGSALTTASSSSVVTINNGGGVAGCNVFWQVGSSATLGTGTDFIGHILAGASITMDTGSSILAGSALARSGAVKLDDVDITNCVFTDGGTTPVVPLPTSAASVLGLLSVAGLTRLLSARSKRTALGR